MAVDLPDGSALPAAYSKPATPSARRLSRPGSRIKATSTATSTVAWA
jgi:hypothetical protein